MPEEQQELFFVYNRPPEDRLPNRERMRPDEVAQVLSCGKSHVYELIEDGSLDATNIARASSSRPTYRVFTASVRRFIESRREGAYE